MAADGFVERLEIEVVGRSGGPIAARHLLGQSGLAAGQIFGQYGRRMRGRRSRRHQPLRTQCALSPRFRLMLQIRNDEIDFRIAQRSRIKSRHLAIWPVPHRARVPDVALERTCREIFSGTHRQIEIWAQISCAAASQLVTHEAVGEEEVLALTSSVSFRQRG